MYTRLLRMLQDESKRWTDHVNIDVVGLPGYSRGMEQGLGFAIKLALNIRSEIESKIEQQKIAKAVSMDFKRTCRSALNYIDNSDYKKARECLERILTRLK